MRSAEYVPEAAQEAHRAFPLQAVVVPQLLNWIIYTLCNWIIYTPIPYTQNFLMIVALPLFLSLFHVFQTSSSLKKHWTNSEVVRKKVGGGAGRNNAANKLRYRKNLVCKCPQSYVKYCSSLNNKIILMYICKINESQLNVVHNLTGQQNCG